MASTATRPVDQQPTRERFGPLRRWQPALGVLALLVVMTLGIPFANSVGTYVLYVVSGVMLGYILTRSRFGFAGGIKRAWVLGDGSLTTALTASFALIAVFTAGIQWHARSKGAVAALAATDGDSIIPGTQNVQAIGIALVIGGILFGAGMIMAGGCASGTLADVGEGAIRAVIALPFFVLGSIPGHWMRYEITQGSLGDVAIPAIYLPDYVGYIGAVALTLAGLIGVYVIVRRYEQRRKREGYFTTEVWDKHDLPTPELETQERFRLFSWRTYHNFFVTRWTFLAGGVLLAFAAAFVLATTGKAWGVTSAFTPWGVQFLNWFGIEFTDPAFASVNETVQAGLVNDGTSVRNLGIIAGAAIAMLLAGKFVFDKKFRTRDAIIFMLGGLLMGIGARLAGGCNVGALYSAIGTFSISGWVFGAALWVGGYGALRLLAGRLNIIPPDRHTLRPQAEQDA